MSETASTWMTWDTAVDRGEHGAWTGGYETARLKFEAEVASLRAESDHLREEMAKMPALIAERVSQITAERNQAQQEAERLRAELAAAAKRARLTCFSRE
jgi:ATPase subunit of ABC transporter with duplicated ATPase domains